MSWTFLTIPPEIRDVIIEIVLLSSRPVPPDVATAALTRQTVVREWNWNNKPFLTWEFGISNVKFEKVAACTTSNALPLLLTNHQLNAETRSAIARLGDRVRCYELDVIVINEHELWPTWTCVPVLTRHVKQVNVTFRLYASQNPDHGSRRDALIGGDGSPPGLVWCFYFVLEHFLRRGPGGPGGTFGVGEKDKEICVKAINVILAPGEGQLILENWSPRRYWADETFADNTRIVQPLWLAQFITAPLRGLLSMNYHTAKYGAILYERVGSIRVSVDGESLRELNIARVLAILAYNDPRYTFGHIRTEDRLSSFWKWKRDAVKLRHEHDLPVEENNVFKE